jgi:hypothetical protein
MLVSINSVFPTFVKFSTEILLKMNAVREIYLPNNFMT